VRGLMAPVAMEGAIASGGVVEPVREVARPCLPGGMDHIALLVRPCADPFRSLPVSVPCAKLWS
jgi:hypothetical protein